MRTGLLVALFLVARLQSLCEGRIVSRCELKNKMSELLDLPPEREVLREKILTRAICWLERHTRLDTEMLQVLERRPRVKRDVEFFEEEMRKLQEEVDAMKSEEQHKQDVKETSSAEVEVIDKLEDEMSPVDDSGVTSQQLNSVLTSLEDSEAENVMRGKEEEVERMVDKPDQDETFKDKERKTISHLDRDATDTQETTAEEKEERIIYDLDQDETETDVSGEKTLINSMDRDETQDTREDVEEEQTNPEVDAAEDVKVEDPSLTGDDEEKASVEDTSDDGGEKSKTPSDTERDVEKDRDDGDTRSMKNRKLKEWVRALIKAMKSAQDEPNQEDQGEGRGEVNMKVLEEVERRVISRLDQDEINPRSSREEELMRHLDQDEMNHGEDRDKLDSGEDTSEDNKDKEDDERSIEENGRMVLEVVRRLMRELEQDMRNPEEDNTEDVTNERILGGLRDIITKLNEDQRDSSRVHEEKPGVDTDGGEDLVQVGESQEDQAGGGRRKRSLSPHRRPLQLFGLLLLSDHLTCQSGSGPSRNLCSTNCAAFVDDDISDDLACFMQIKAWRHLVRHACPAPDFFQDC